MGGGTQTQQQAKNQISIPPWLKPLLENTSNEFLFGQQAIPTLAQLFSKVPGLQVPNLTAEQQKLINMITGAGESAASYLGDPTSPTGDNTVTGFGGSTPVSPVDLSPVNPPQPAPTPLQPNPPAPESPPPGPVKKKKKAADGAQWDVGGQGGTDSQLVQFLASPNETVTVTKPGQSPSEVLAKGNVGEGVGEENAALLKMLGIPGFKKGGVAKPATGPFGIQLPDFSNLLPNGYTPPYANGFGGAFTPPPPPPPPQGATSPPPQWFPIPPPVAQPPQQAQPAGLAPQAPATPTAPAAPAQPAGNPYPGAGAIIQPDQSKVDAGFNDIQGAIGTIQGGLANQTDATGAVKTGLSTLGDTATGLKNYVGTLGTPSAATLAAQDEFKKIQAPLLEQQAALTGNANGGALLSAESLGEAAALTPLLQSDESNSLNALSTLSGVGSAQAGAGGILGGIGNNITNAGSAIGGLGSAAGNLGLGSGSLNLEAQQAAQATALNEANFAQNQLQQALVAAGIPQENAAQQAQALYQQLSNQFNFAQGVDTGPASLFGDIFGGSKSSGSSTSTPPKF